MLVIKSDKIVFVEISLCKVFICFVADTIGERGLFIIIYIFDILVVNEC